LRRVRVIPVLLLQHQKLVKTTQFKSPSYVGDPINTLKIFNEKEVDELVILDINATRLNEGPDISFVKSLTSECFMPLGYGGGITKLEHANLLFSAGVEKIIIGTSAFTNSALIGQMAAKFGSQAIVVSVDVKRDIFNRPFPYIQCGQKKINENLIDYCKRIENEGAGEILYQSINREGTRTGYDLEMISKISSHINIPLVASGGAGQVEDFLKAVTHGASAVAAGDMFVYKGPHKAVLINYPSQKELQDKLYTRL
jgi:imidazole glycerol-phosphate synthase subunit HisF